MVSGRFGGVGGFVIHELGFVIRHSSFSIRNDSLVTRPVRRSNDEMIRRNDETGPLNDVIKRANDETGDGAWAVEYLPIYAAFLTEPHQMKSGLRTFHHPLNYRVRPVSPFMGLVSAFVTPVSAFATILSSLARSCVPNDETGLPNDETVKTNNETAPAGEIKKLPDGSYPEAEGVAGNQFSLISWTARMTLFIPHHFSAMFSNK